MTGSTAPGVPSFDQLTLRVVKVVETPGSKVVVSSVRATRYFLAWANSASICFSFLTSCAPVLAVTTSVSVSLICSLVTSSLPAAGAR
jgi:hypothetical protein